MKDASRFSLVTLMEAAQLLTFGTQAEFNRLILRLSIDKHVPLRLDLSKENKANLLIQFAKENPGHKTVSESKSDG